MALNSEYSSQQAPQVRQLHERQEIAETLIGDKIANAYALANLEPGAFDRTEWYLAEDSESLTLAMLYKAYQPSLLFATGRREGLGAILDSAVNRRELYFSVELGLLDAASAYYNNALPEVMIRMKTSEATFRPVLSEAIKLSRHNVNELNSLYRTTLTSVFTMAQIQDGIYYGIWENGRLVSVAGTHFISTIFGVGAVGNVYTHPERRGRGYARKCTGAVTAELLKTVPEVVLNVNSKNAPALRVYSSLGYEEHCRLAEMMGTRKGAGHLKDVLMRFLNR